MDACCPELNPGMRLMTSKEHKDVVDARAKDLRKQAQALMSQAYQLKETTKPPPVIVAAGNELIGVLTLLNRPELAQTVFQAVNGIEDWTPAFLHLEQRNRKRKSDLDNFHDVLDREELQMDDGAMPPPPTPLLLLLPDAAMRPFPQDKETRRSRRPQTRQQAQQTSR